MNYLEKSLTIYCFHDIGVLMKGMVKCGAWIQKRRSTFFVKIWDCDIVVILAKFFDHSLAHFFDIYNFLWNILLNPAPLILLIWYFSHQNPILECGGRIEISVKLWKSVKCRKDELISKPVSCCSSYISTKNEFQIYWEFLIRLTPTSRKKQNYQKLSSNPFLFCFSMQVQ